MASAKHGAELLVLKKKLMPRKEGSPDVYRDRASLGNKTAITLTATRMHERVECCGKEASDAALETSCASRFPAPIESAEQVAYSPPMEAAGPNLRILVDADACPGLCHSNGSASRVGG